MPLSSTFSRVALSAALVAAAGACTRAPAPDAAPSPAPEGDEHLARIAREDAADPAPAEPAAAEPETAPEVPTPTPPAPAEPDAREADDAGAPAGAVTETDGGRLRVVNGVRVLELWGTPEEMGRAHGTLLRDDVRRVLKDVIEDAVGLDRIMEGTRVMEPFQDARHRREMRALADAAGVDYMKIVALQLFGDAERGNVPKAGATEGGDLLDDIRGTEFDRALERAEAPVPGLYACTTYAVFGPATRTGECIVGRNFDFWYQEVAKYASIVIHYRHEPPLHSFVTFTWAGVVNGWTLMSDAGVCAANNLSYGRVNSLEGVSTCFLQRLVVERAGSVAEGIEVARAAARAVGTAMLVAGGDPPDAVELEFDHAELHVRKAHEGWVIADNSSRVLRDGRPLGPEEEAFGRYGTLLELVKRDHGRIDRTMNFAAARGVALEGMNLHSAMLFPKDLEFAVSMGSVPACREPFRRFRMTARGVESAE